MPRYSGALVLHNADQSALDVRQIARHLGTRAWNITRELQLAAKGEPGRLQGTKVTGPGTRGRGGQWRVDRTAYLDWLGVPEQDRKAVGDDGLPLLYDEPAAAAELNLTSTALRRALLRLSVSHVMVGWRRYVTHNQLQRLRVALDEDCRDRPR
jgi:hypothetical protein